MTTNQHQWRYTTAHHPAQALPRTHGVVVALRDRGSIERVGLDDVGTSHEVLLVDASDDVRLRQIEDVVVASQVRVMVCEPFAAVVLLHKLVLLDHGAHGAIDDEDPLRQLRAQVRLQVSGAPHIGIHVDRLAVFSSHLAYSRAQGQCTDTVSTEKSRLCCCNVRQPCDENAQTVGPAQPSKSLQELLFAVPSSSIPSCIITEKWKFISLIITMSRIAIYAG